MDPVLQIIVAFIVGAVLGAAAMLLIAKNNPTQAAAATSDILASEGRIVAAVNSAKDALSAHTTATAAVAAPAAAKPAAVPPAAS